MTGWSIAQDGIPEIWANNLLPTSWKKSVAKTQASTETSQTYFVKTSDQVPDLNYPEAQTFESKQF